MKKVHWGKVYNPTHIKLSTHIPNKTELHLTAHAPTGVGATELHVYPSKSLMW